MDQMKTYKAESPTDMLGKRSKNKVKIQHRAFHILVDCSYPLPQEKKKTTQDEIVRSNQTSSGQ